MDIELATDSVFEAFGPAAPQFQEARAPESGRGRDAARGKAAPRTGRRRRPCACGECATCKENARWERIFNEKFANPDYYKRPCFTSGSSLSSWG